jgi:hypothetical protein
MPTGFGECNKEDAVGPVGQLRQLGPGQMNAEGAGGVEKARLPKNGEVKETFDQNHIVVMGEGSPGEEAAFGTWKESMGRSVNQFRRRSGREQGGNLLDNFSDLASDGTGFHSER